MSRQKGTFEFSNNLEVKIAGTLDARAMVSSYSDLLTFTTDNYLINGYTVSVYDTDSSKCGIYQLINQALPGDASSWVKITSNLQGTSGTSGGQGTSGMAGTSGSSGSSGADGSSFYNIYQSSYSSSETVPQSVGGIKSGTPVSALDGLNFSDMFDKLLFPAIAPTVTLTKSSGTIEFNQNNVSIGLAFGYTINSVGAFVQTAVLSYKFGTSGTSVTIDSSTLDTSFTHNYSYGVNSYSTTPLIYTYTVTDTTGAINSATITVTPTAYVNPTIVFSAPAISLGSIDSNQIRETGNTGSTLQGSTTQNSSLIPIQSYQYAVSTNGGSTWTNLGSSTSLASTGGSFTNYPDTSLGSSVTSAIYRVIVTDQFTTTTATYTITFKNIIFYGPVSAISTTSSQVRSLSGKIFVDGSNPFTLVTGTTNNIFEVALPGSHSITNVSDLTVSGADITSQYVLSVSLTSINDALGTSTSYKVYNMTTSLAYSPSHNHQITRS